MTKHDVPELIGSLIAAAILAGILVGIYHLGGYPAEIGAGFAILFVKN